MYLHMTEMAELHAALNNAHYNLSDKWPEEHLARRELIMGEEWAEFKEALWTYPPNKTMVLAEAIDLMVTILGTLVSLGYTPEQVHTAWYAILRANEAKEPHPEGLKWVKPAGWQPADLTGILGEPHQGQLFPDDEVVPQPEH